MSNTPSPDCSLPNNGSTDSASYYDPSYGKASYDGPSTDPLLYEHVSYGASSSVGALEQIVCEPDSNNDYVDGVYITFAKLANLIGRANASSSTHCAGCTCTE